MIHRVSVYTKAGVIAHVQSTNSDEWPHDVREFDLNGVETPLVRVDVELEPTPEEIAESTDGRPVHRKASVLFREELEIVGGRIRYRAGKGAGGAISDRVPDVAPV